MTVDDKPHGRHVPRTIGKPLPVSIIVIIVVLARLYPNLEVMLRFGR